VGGGGERAAEQHRPQGVRRDVARLREPGDEHAHGGVRPRRDARRGSDDDAGAVSVAPEVRLYHAVGCHLCERARAIVADARSEVSFELTEIDISGDPELEQAYREWLPVVEIDGRRAFVYHVDPGAFRRKVSQ